METSQGSLPEVVNILRRLGTDLHSVEVKAAVRELPKSLWPTVSAFSNHGGGLIILGLDEENGFAPAVGFDPLKIRDAAAEAFRPRSAKEPAGPITPRPMGFIDIAEIDGSPVVVIDIEELEPESRPAYVSSQGIETGTYERVGDGDRRMSSYGIFLLASDAGQPHHDIALVEGSTIADLDHDLMERFISRLRRTRPRSIAGLSETSDILGDTM